MNVDGEIRRILDIESKYGLNSELTEYLKWLIHKRETNNSKEGVRA